MGGLIGMIIASSTDIITKFVINDIGPFLPKAALYRLAEYTGTNPKFKDLADAENVTEIKELDALNIIKYSSKS